jgi:hypothetical protein
MMMMLMMLRLKLVATLILTLTLTLLGAVFNLALCSHRCHSRNHFSVRVRLLSPQPGIKLNGRCSFSAHIARPHPPPPSHMRSFTRCLRASFTHLPHLMYSSSSHWCLRARFTRAPPPPRLCIWRRLCACFTQ